MFNNLRKFLQGEVSLNKLSLNSCFCSLITAFVLVSGVVNIARADVCFLPDSEGCEMVPYEEYGGTPNYPKNCFATKAEAMSARTASLDSYYQNGNMWCIKQSCSASLYNSNYKGGNWSCDKCHDANSTRANLYNCTCPLTAKSGYEINYNTCAYVISQCTGSATTSCETSDCQTCAGTGQYSGENECKIPTPVNAHCPEGYVPDKPSSKCYSTQDMLCGEGKCYKAATTIPDCSGEGKQLSDDNGACWCSCKTGYHDDGKGNCVLNQCTSGVAENTCGTGYTFAATGTPFTNTNGKTVRCGECALNTCATGVAENTCDTASGYTFTSNGTSFKDNSNNTISCGSCDVASCPWGTSTSPGEVQCDTRCQMYTVAGYSGGHECYSCVNNYQDANYAPVNGTCCQRHIQGGAQFNDGVHYATWTGERHLVTTELCRWFNPDYDYSDCEPSPRVSDNICEIFYLGYCRRPIKLIASLGPDNSCSYDVYLNNGHIDDDFLIFHDGAVIYKNDWTEAHDVSSLYVGTLWAGHTMSIYAIDYKNETIIWTGTVDLWLHQ